VGENSLVQNVCGVSYRKFRKTRTTGPPCVTHYVAYSPCRRTLKLVPVQSFVAAQCGLSANELRSISHSFCCRPSVVGSTMSSSAPGQDFSTLTGQLHRFVFGFIPSNSCWSSVYISKLYVLPATRCKWTCPVPQQAGTRFAYPGWMEGRVHLGGWLYISRWFTYRLTDGPTWLYVDQDQRVTAYFAKPAICHHYAVK